MQDFEKKLNVTFAEFCGIGRIGTMFFQLGNKNKARKIFEGLVEMNPESADAHSALGGVLVSMNGQQQAVPHLLKAIEINPQLIAPYVNLAEIYLSQAKFTEAIENLKKAISLDTDHKSFAANRARMLILGINKLIKLAS